MKLKLILDQHLSFELHTTAKTLKPSAELKQNTASPILQLPD